VKAGQIRRLAAEHSREALDAAADALAEGEPSPIPVEGKDEGEQLTNLMVAARVRARMDERGEPLPDAFKAVMDEVRDVIRNAPPGA
jgi:hypothetical protein